MKKHLLSMLAFLLVLSAVLPTAGAQNNEQAPISFFQHFAQQTEEIPVLTLKTDTKKLIKDKKKESYQSASITFHGLDGEAIEMDAKVRSRGNIRKEVCYFPPLKLKMKKKALSKLDFDTLNQVKMVIQCQSNKIGLSYLLKEQLIYQLHQPIGPISYQTKLIKINLIDPKGKTQELFGFLIEEEREFAKRLSGQILEVGKISDRLVDRDAYLKMVFFQYMILNTDWQMMNRHNLEFIRLDGQTLFSPVPYDFDYAGMVGTSYAVPDPSRGIKRVTDPCFLGKEVTPEEAQAMAVFYLSKKEAIYKQLDAFVQMTEKDKVPIRKRLDHFFNELSNEKVINNNFVTGK
jgi:hypothetical protein